MLRAHAEHRCLSKEVLPVLRQIETRSELPDDQIGAALTYLEFAWLQARRHAVETDSARLALGDRATFNDRATLDDRPGQFDRAGLSGSACRYCSAVRRLRTALAARVAPLLDADEGAASTTPVIRRLSGGPATERAASGGPDHHAHGSP